MRNKKTQANAKVLRKRLTDAEQHLWRQLRRRQLRGYKFRRQYPVGNYVTDFACIEAGLIIEIDGSQHSEQAEADETRIRFLEQRGFKVLRFLNNAVLTETDSVLETILEALPPKPPPARGRGRIEPASSFCPCLPMQETEPQNLVFAVSDGKGKAPHLTPSPNYGGRPG